MAKEFRAVTRVVVLRPGLYLLRYVSAEDQRYPPRVLVVADPDQAEGVRFQPVPGRADTLLRGPGEVLIVAVEGEVRLLVTTLREAAGISDTIVLKIDRLDAPQAAASAPAHPVLPVRAADPRKAPARALRLGAHVERVGDMIVDCPDWVGGEGGRAPIEGLSLFWPNRPEGVDIEYSVSLLGRGRLPNTLTGGFVGTRGQGRAINGVFMSVVGPRASEYRLVVEAVFTEGEGISASEGRAVQLYGPTGREVLVGLSVRLEEALHEGAASSPAIGPVDDARGEAMRPAESVSNLSRLAPKLQIRRPARGGGY